jgi:hypothetical protein
MQRCITPANCSWKQIAKSVMPLCTETMDGSTIEERGTILVRNYVCVKSLDLRSTRMNFLEIR